MNAPVLLAATFDARRVALVIRPPEPARPVGWAGIDRRRRARGWGLERLAREAGVAYSVVKRARRGARMTRATLAKLDAALEASGVPHKRRPVDRLRLIRVSYRAFVAVLAPRMKVRPEQVLAADPRATGGPSRLRSRIAAVRQRAFYLCVTELDLSLSDMARAIGITKQGVSKALGDIEDERETPRLDALLNEAALAVVGG